MIDIKDKSKCCGCKGCANVCPKKAITFSSDEEGFAYPSVDQDLCFDCHLCEKVCPFLKSEPKRISVPLTYAAKIKDLDIRDNSSSGGLFSVFANKILNEDGVVYGVKMDSDMKSASFTRVDNIDDLSPLRGSKYLQADTHNIYKDVNKDLSDGKKVLFTGVPCQIDALKLYLQKEYDNLYLVEVICHGTPSPKLWKTYVEYLEEKYNATIESVDFRNKKYGWKKFGLKKKGDNIDQYLDISTDPYMVMFLRDYCLRSSCYNCNAKKLESMADITIADFWGIEHVLPQMDDDTGTSLVLIQSNKGEKLFNSIVDEIIYEETNFDDAIKYNPSYYKPVNKPFERDSFFNYLDSMTFKDLQDKYCHVSTKTKIKGIMYKVPFVQTICGGG